ncbi:MAG: NAD-dependent epimerase/dehydratase family protein [Thermoplasmata archaeon]
MTVLVTGGAGYLGSRLIRELPRMPGFQGQTIRILDNMFRERYVSLWNLPEDTRYEFLEGDVRNEEDVRRALQDAETVFSLSDITNAPLSFERKELTREVNLKGALNVFEHAIKAGVEKFVYTSTCSVYGPTEGVVDEDALCQPISPYGETKLEAERTMKRRAEEVGFNWTALRLGTVHGWTIGMRFDTIVNRFSYLAAQGQPLTVYDTAWREKRPYLHVSDAMAAYELAAGHPKTNGQVFNVVGENANMDTVISAIKAVVPDVDVTTTKTPSLNQLSYEVDCSRFQKLGFEAKKTITDGVKEMVRKFRGIAHVPLPNATLEP